MRTIISESLCHEGITHITADAEKGYYSSKPFTLEYWADRQNYADTMYTDFRDEIDCGGVYTITVCAADGQIVYDVAALCPYVDVQHFSGEDWYQFRRNDVSKGRALAMLDMPPTGIVAFGDDSNDIDMLEYAGVSIAMSNAIPECKAVADYICGDCDDDGVAEWIEANVLL